jgi:hypothetical protein
MLFDVQKNQLITAIPHERDYQIWISRLDPIEIQSIKDKLNSMIDADEIHTSCWMPGADWTNTPFQAIYEKAARFNFESAAHCFGLMVWVVFMERPEEWGFGRYEKNGHPITGITYFRLHNQN